jgi:hypothetical protein
MMTKASEIAKSTDDQKSEISGEEFLACAG